MGAEADGLAAGAGLAMTTAGGGTAGVGWMGCTYEKRANKPLLPTCPAQGVGAPTWVRDRGTKRQDVHTRTCAPAKSKTRSYFLPPTR